MKLKPVIIVFSILTLLYGCVTLPTGPSVMVLPGEDKTFDQFQFDDNLCRQWAAQRTGLPPQETVNRNTAQGAAVGTAIGAGLGAIIGSASGHAGSGALIGAGTGLFAGTASGADAGRVYGWEAQQRYDNAYQQCMYAKGNKIPGAVSRTRRIRRIPPPPDSGSVPPDYYEPSQPPRGQ